MPFESVQHKYKFGNSFTEEAAPVAETPLSKPQAPVKTSVKPVKTR